MFLPWNAALIKISNTLTMAECRVWNVSKPEYFIHQLVDRTEVFKYLTSTVFCIIFAAPLEFDPVSDYPET